MNCIEGSSLNRETGIYYMLSFYKSYQLKPFSNHFIQNKTARLMFVKMNYNFKAWR